jgi:L-ascorbate metabolism protein UlaG (beta-lactamase superfamily)
MKFCNLTMRVFLALAGFFSATGIASAQPESAPLPGDNIALMGGVMRLTPLFHASLMLEYKGKVIYVDPVSAAPLPKKADLIIITHSHGDHLDLSAINRVTRRETKLVAPAGVQSEIAKHPVAGFLPIFTIIDPGARQTVAGISIQAVPAYNLVRGPKAGQKFHPKGQWNGYVLTIGGKKIYIAGDTEATPEMKALKNITVAFVPMNLPYTMTPQEAAAGVRAFKPRFVYPYHYRYPFNKANTNPQQFASALRGSGVQVRIRNWYPSAAVARAMKAAG